MKHAAYNVQGLDGTELTGACVGTVVPASDGSGWIFHPRTAGRRKQRVARKSPAAAVPQWAVDAIGRLGFVAVLQEAGTRNYTKL